MGHDLLCSILRSILRSLVRLLLTMCILWTCVFGLQMGLGRPRLLRFLIGGVLRAYRRLKGICAGPFEVVARKRLWPLLHVADACD
ncbi:hypothetical protein HanRHA438_Chr13g0597191 [Helianthus annuus]|nr:hypothetical protein HanRHA438_Chr13g0597191 [Helianthus annuus]